MGSGSLIPLRARLVAGGSRLRARDAGGGDRGDASDDGVEPQLHGSFCSSVRVNEWMC